MNEVRQEENIYCLKTTQLRRYRRGQYWLKQEHKDELIHIHSRYNIACMKYLSYNLVYGPNGYRFLEKYFFQIWKKEWKNLCLRENISYNHGLIKYGLNFFTQTYYYHLKKLISV